jgi:RimJ/RimL family protein N-acetyltransferase
VADVRIDLVRLTEVPLDAVVALLNEPRNTRHMPLSNPFTPESAREWVQAKDGQWAEHGYGPLAVLPHTRSPDRAVARLGFQPDGEVDYGGVVFRQYRLTRQAWTAARGPA